jgi:hypothetical protein
MNKVVSQVSRHGQRVRRTTAVPATMRAAGRSAHPREHCSIRPRSAGGPTSPLGQYRTVIGAIAAARSGMVFQIYWRPSRRECHHSKVGCKSPAARGAGLMLGVGLTRNTS